MSGVAIAFDLLQVQLPRHAVARLLGRRLRLSAASYGQVFEMTDWHTVPIFGELTRYFPATIRPSAYAVISDGQERLAVVRTPKGYFLPGGGQDDGESAEATVIREAAEECALALRLGPWRAAAIEHVSSTTEQAHFEKRSTFCDATAVGRPTRAGELDHQLAWMSASEAVALLTPASHRWAVNEWWSARGARPSVAESGTRPPAG